MDNRQQSEFWNGDAGQRWVAFSDRLDAMLLPFAELILEAADLAPHETVLDIGCGAGALSLLASKQATSVLGVDISQPLIDLANKRSALTEAAAFQCDDAASLDFKEKRDVVLSRFGVMFFSDPAQAFAKISQQVTPGGRMVFACWQSPMRNLWAKAPLEAAMPFFKEAPTPPEPFVPGPFAFADPNYVKGVLQAAGWVSVALNDWTGDIRLPGADAHEAASFMMEMGPLSKIMKEQDLNVEKVQSALIDRLAQNSNFDGTVDMQASVWIVSASKTS
jgi:SAM-dependent methyltransferase